MTELREPTPEELLHILEKAVRDIDREAAIRGGLDVAAEALEWVARIARNALDSFEPASEPPGGIRELAPLDRARQLVRNIVSGAYANEAEAARMVMLAMTTPAPATPDQGSRADRLYRLEEEVYWAARDAKLVLDHEAHTLDETAKLLGVLARRTETTKETP
jgi:hypothetical protein